MDTKDIKEAYEYFASLCETLGNCDYDNKVCGTAMKVLENQLQGESVKVVRCKDCKFFNENHWHCTVIDGETRCLDPDEYCSYGERRNRERENCRQKWKALDRDWRKARDGNA